MKKICAILFALMIVVSALSVSVLAAGDPQLTVTTDKSVVKEVGEVVTVTVTLDNAAGVTSIGFDLSYPGFEFVTGSNSSPIAGSFMMCQYVPSTQKFLATGAMVPLDDNSVVAMTFQLKATSVGDSTIGISNCQIAVGSTKYTPSGVSAQITHEHVWGEATVVEATCKNDGSETRTCTVSGCDKTDVKVLPATGEHNYKEVDHKDATCKDAGYTKYECGCGESYTDTIPATGKHDYKEVDHKDPTCKEDGFCKFECTGCGDTYTETKPATGNHNFVVVDQKDATCKEDGYTKYACGCGTEGETIVLPKLSHDYKLVERVEPTCKETGYESYKCTMCEEPSDKILQMVDHKFENYAVTKEATCTKDGEEVGTCAFGCGTTNTLPIDKLGHKWGEWKVTVEATKTEDGEKVRVCEVCEKSETKEIPATGSVAPKTGDEANIALYAVMFVMAGAAVVALSSKKKEN